MRKKNSLIFAMVFAIIYISFRFPDILLQMQERNMESSVHEKERATGKIDIEVEDTYLVRAIHDICGENGVVHISNETSASESFQEAGYKEDKSDNKEKLTRFEKEFEKIEKCGITSAMPKLDNSRGRVISVGYYVGKKEYVVYLYVSNYFDNKVEMRMERETGKLLNVMVESDAVISEEEKEGVLRAYISYLELDHIGDWKYEKGSLISDKARLVADLTDMEWAYSLSIGSGYQPTKKK